MLRKFVLPLAALAMLVFAVYHVVRAQQVPPKLDPPVSPARSPFGKGVAGAGLVEAETENIAVGTNLPGIVTEVYVKVGAKVKNGEALFKLDERALKAEWRVRKAALDSAIGDEERNRREQAATMARDQVRKAAADLALMKAGAWKPDLQVAEASVAQMKAMLEQTETELERLEVRALVDGEVLQRNVRPGEYVNTQSGQALIVLGSVSRMHVRVDIDEHDIPRFELGAKAKAMLRGDPRQEFGLRFLRVEPFVIPKKSLTGDNTERVDTRVLQVIYALDDSTRRVFVGQQLDVYVEGVK
jgi:RND family efflux transporter MFP subunit